MQAGYQESQISVAIENPLTNLNEGAKRKKVIQKKHMLRNKITGNVNRIFYYGKVKAKPFYF